MIQLTQYSFSSVFIKLKRNVTKHVRCGATLAIWLKWRHGEEKIEKEGSYKCNHQAITRKLKTWSSLNIIWRTWFYYQDINVWPRLAAYIPNQPRSQGLFPGNEADTKPEQNKKIKHRRICKKKIQEKINWYVLLLSNILSSNIQQFPLAWGAI